MPLKHYVIFINKSLPLLFLLFFISSSTYAFPYKGLDLKIQATLSEMYDDNLTFSKEDIKEDLITTLGLGITAMHEGKRRQLALNGQINQRFHARFSDIKSSSESVSINFNNEFSEYDSLAVSDRFSHSQTPAGFEEEFGRVEGRRNTYSNVLNLNYRRNIIEHLSSNLFYSNAYYFYPEEEREDTSNNSVGANLNFMPGPFTSFSVSYNYSKNSFGNTSQNALLGIKRYLTLRTFVDGKVGLGISSVEGGDSNTRLNTHISITNEIDKNSVATVSFSRSEQFVSESGDVFRNWRFTGLIRNELLKRLISSLSAFYGKGTFSSSDITNTLLGANLDLAYAFTEDFNGSIGYNYSNYDSTAEYVGYIRNAFLISLNKSF